jgi:hypothetical protein
LETLKPANSMIASLGTGMQADSSVISRNTATTPAEPMNSVATSTIGSTTLSVMLASRRRVTGEAEIVGRELNSD